LRGRGAVAPGYRADLVVLDELETFRVKQVYKDGRLVVDEGRPVGLSRSKGPTFEDRPLNIPPLDPKRFRIMATGTTARIIRLLPGQILTGVAYRKIQSESGLVKSDPETDILKLAVAERHRGTGRIGLGLVQGFGLKRGAMASSVAHDSHNLISVGVEDRDLCRAVEEVKEMGGGMAVVSDETLLSKVPLPVGGLMSLEPLEGLTEQLEALNRAAASLGCRVPDPFMVLSFLSLPVIPELKLTDLGLVDVNRFSVVPLFVEDLSP
jgi:adenine deaminase